MKVGGISDQKCVWKQLRDLWWDVRLHLLGCRKEKQSWNKFFLHLQGDFVNVVAARLIANTKEDAQHVVRPAVAHLNEVHQHTIQCIHLAPPRVGSTPFRWSLVKLGDEWRFVSQLEPPQHAENTR